MQFDLPDVVYDVPSKSELREAHGSFWWLAEKMYKTMWLRTVLSERQNHRCAYCGIVTNLVRESKQRATVEHVLTRSRGGRDHPDDCVMACARCNGKRGEKVLPEEQIVLEWRRQELGAVDREEGLRCGEDRSGDAHASARSVLVLPRCTEIAE
ncbi:MAG: HNH endonuclease [Verrucomicrobiaceae bacterium]|nr:MAG: HNH endonuclease [Verrucomicrobiaceae bacterium]